jgi:tetratricopeptide (TPR) repeat protein
LSPRSANFRHNLGVALLKKGIHDETITCLLEAVRMEPDHAQAHYNLGNVLMAKGRLDEAAGSFREAVRHSPDYAEAWCNLGLNLQRQGQHSSALDALRRGHEIGSSQPGWSYPSDRWIRECEAAIAKQRESGTLPSDQRSLEEAVKLLSEARRALESKQTLLAVHHYVEAFAKKAALAEDLQQAHRYQAAAAAVQAVGDPGDDVQDLPDAERTELRRKALLWLTADLAAWRKRVDGGSIAKSRASQVLGQWLEDPALVPIRDEEFLIRLPPGERTSWETFWSEVRTLIEILSG